MVRRPGKQNIVSNALSRLCSVMCNGLNLVEMDVVLGNPGVTGLSRFVKTKHLPFSVEDVKKVCSIVKFVLSFFQKPVEIFVKAMHP